MDDVIIGTNSLLSAAKRLRDRGEITSLQYNEMLKRSKSTPTEWREDRRITLASTGMHHTDDMGASA